MRTRFEDTIEVHDRAESADWSNADNNTTESSEVTHHADDEPKRQVAPEHDATNVDFDPLVMYFREIATHKLLTAKEEVALGRRIQRGDEAARQEMILCNLRLVVCIARHYDNCGLAMLDLVSEGNMGLMRAVERFDPERGNRFSTYAAFWIKQHIRRALMNHSRTVRVPVHVFEKNFRLTRLAARLHSELERAPTNEELATEMGVSAERVQQMRKAGVTITSFDAPVGDDQVETFASHFADERAADPLGELAKQSQLSLLEGALASLSPREQKVLRERYGLEGHDKRTLEEIGDDLGLTRERVRQIQVAAVRKLRRRLDQLEKTHTTRSRVSAAKNLRFAQAA